MVSKKSRFWKFYVKHNFSLFIKWSRLIYLLKSGLVRISYPHCNKMVFYKIFEKFVFWYITFDPHIGVFLQNFGGNTSRYGRYKVAFILAFYNLH